MITDILGLRKKVYTQPNGWLDKECYKWKTTVPARKKINRAIVGGRIMDFQDSTWMLLTIQISRVGKNLQIRDHYMPVENIMSKREISRLCRNCFMISVVDQIYLYIIYFLD